MTLHLTKHLMRPTYDAYNSLQDLCTRPQFKKLLTYASPAVLRMSCFAFMDDLIIKYYHKILAPKAEIW